MVSRKEKAPCSDVTNGVKMDGVNIKAEGSGDIKSTK